MIINVKEIVTNWKQELCSRIESLTKKPSLTVFMVGDNFASKKYVANKEKVAKEIGIDSCTINLPESVSADELVDRIKACNSDALMVQLPLPPHIDLQKVIEAIPTNKDADGFTSEIVGNLSLGVFGEKDVIPCTPKGIMRVLSSYELCGKSACVIGRSNLVGKPIANLLINKGMTVTVCNSKTDKSYLKMIVENSDVVVVATGHPNTITADMVSPNTIVIDVGINRGNDGKIVGDCDPKISEIANLTPVPGGIGLTTVVALMDNVITLAECENFKKV